MADPDPPNDSPHLWSGGGSATVSGGNLDPRRRPRRHRPDLRLGPLARVRRDLQRRVLPARRLRRRLQRRALGDVQRRGTRRASSSAHARTATATDMPLGPDRLPAPLPDRVERRPTSSTTWTAPSWRPTRSASEQRRCARWRATSTPAARKRLDRLDPDEPVSGVRGRSTRACSTPARAEWGQLGSGSSLNPGGAGGNRRQRSSFAPATPPPRTASWSGWTPITHGGDVPGNSRYVQYRADLSTTDPGQTPVLGRVEIALDLSPTAVNDSRTVNEDSSRRPRSTSSPTTPTPTAARRRSPRSTPAPRTAPSPSPTAAPTSPTRPTPTTATTPPGPDRHLHLHPERRLDGDGLGRRSPASTTTRPRSTTRGRSPRTPARTR